MPPLQGDPLPPFVAQYYAALDRGDAGAVADCVTEDVLFTFPGPAAAETDGRQRLVGRAAVRQMFEARGKKPHRHEVRICGASAGDCIVEGAAVEANGHATTTFASSYQLDGNGRIARSLTFTCSPPVEPWTGDDGHAIDADAAALTDRYFDHLRMGDFDVAAACFSSDVLYSHPPYKHTNITRPGRVEFRGRDELRAGFGARGKQSFGHRMVATIQRGRHYLFEGVVEGLPNGSFGSFVSVLTLGDDDLAKRYISFFCEPGVERR